MSISGVGGTSTLAILSAQTNGTQKPTDLSQATQQGPSFTERMEGALNKVSEAQNTAAKSAHAYETGATEDLASVMIDQQVSSLGFQMTLQVRNKALTAYRDIMNMPV